MIDEHEFIAQRGKQIHQKFDFGDGSREICHNYTKEPEYNGGMSTDVIGKANTQEAYGTDSANAAQDLLKMWSKRVDATQVGHLGREYQKASGVPTLRLANRKEPKYKYEATYCMKTVIK